MPDNDEWLTKLTGTCKNCHIEANRHIPVLTKFLHNPYGVPGVEYVLVCPRNTFAVEEPEHKPPVRRVK